MFWFRFGTNQSIRFRSVLVRETLQNIFCTLLRSFILQYSIFISSFQQTSFGRISYYFTTISKVYVLRLRYFINILFLYCIMQDYIQIQDYLQCILTMSELCIYYINWNFSKICRNISKVVCTSQSIDISYNICNLKLILYNISEIF